MVSDDRYPSLVLPAVSRAGLLPRASLIGVLKMNKLRKYGVTLGLVAAGALPVFAEGNANDGFDTIATALSTEVQTWTGKITGFFSQNATSIFAVLGIALGITLVWTIYKFFTKGTRKVG